MVKPSCKSDYHLDYEEGEKMNYHSDKWIMDRVREHYNEALEYFPEDRIVCLILQGSQNYQLDTPNSDVDTKLIVTPTFEDLVFNRKPYSTTHIRENNEHIDFKDVRLYLETFRKQNLNFLEILYSQYSIVNPKYESMWNILIENREAITHYNPLRAVKSMKGIAMEKYHAMEHPYPSKIELIEKYGYDFKQLHHLLRVEDYLERYIAGEDYKSCLSPTSPEYLVAVKQGKYNLAEARLVANGSIERITMMCDEFYANHEERTDQDVDKMLDNVQYQIMYEALYGGNNEKN